MKRRAFLANGGTCGIALSVPSIISTHGFAAMMPSDITSLSAIDLSIAIQERHVSCVEVMRAYLERIHKYNGIYNAIVSLQSDEDLFRQALEADNELAKGNYRGWMHGMPHAGN